jgi:mono/diheme cytochrome c family protein
VVRRALLIAVLTVISCAFVRSQNAKTAGKASAGGNKDLVARGQYIVDGVAMCGQCHTPRDGQGVPERSHWLEGASLWLTPAQPAADWPLQAPRLAGSPPGTDADMVKLLTTGIWSTGAYLRPPMPQFRMNVQDAEAVVAYLKSLTPMPK